MKLEINNKLWEAIIGLLQELPAKNVRAVLNSIDHPDLCKVIEENPETTVSTPVSKKIKPQEK